MVIDIISEDSSKDSFDTIKNIISKSISHINHNVDLNKIEFRDRYNKNPLVKGSQWKSTKKNYRFRELMNFIFSDINKSDHYVFWHIDADITFKNFSKDPNNSDNYKQFENLVRLHPCKMDADQSRIFILLPCYSIESWLFPFVEKLDDKIYDFKYSSIDINDFDEILLIKDKKNSGIGDVYNKDLSSYIVPSQLISVKKSFFTSFRYFSTHNDFLASLQKNYYDWMSQ